MGRRADGSSHSISSSETESGTAQGTASFLILLDERCEDPEMSLLTGQLSNAKHLAPLKATPLQS